MKALILKDFLQLKSYRKNLIVSLAIYIGLILLNRDEPSMLYVCTGMISFLFSIFAIGTFNYDEKNNTDRYVLTLPITRKDTIKAKYVFVLIALVAGIILGMVIGGTLLSFGYIRNVNIMEYLGTITGIFYALSLIISIQIPCIYKYGAEKGRTQIYIIVLGIALLIGLTAYILPDNLLSFSFLDKINSIVSLNILIPSLALILVIFNYIISYIFSCKIYLKKDL